MAEDLELLNAWASGDERAGVELFGRHYDSVFRFFNSKGVSDLEDLVQETFLALARGCDAYRGEGSFRGYVFGTARNVLRQHFRRHRRKEGNFDFGSTSVVDLVDSPSEIVAKRAERRLLLEGLRRLAIDDQIVIELYLWESMTATEIGEVLGLGEAAVRSRLHRAKSRLTEDLQSLAASPGLLASTMSDLESWSRRVREAAEVGG